MDNPRQDAANDAGGLVRIEPSGQGYLVVDPVMSIFFSDRSRAYDYFEQFCAYLRGESAVIPEAA